MAAPTWAWVTATFAGSTSSATPAYPASGVTAGDKIYLACFSKASSGSGEPPTPATPSGWSLVFHDWGGTGTSGAGTGPVKCTVFQQNTDAAGTENGTNGPAIANPSGSSFVYVGLFGVRPVTVGDSFSYAEAGGSDTVSDTSFSVTVASDPGITTDDLLLAFYGGTVATGTSWSAEGISATGATIGTVTERMDSSTTSGNDCRGGIASAACTGGTSSAAAVVTATAAAATTGFGGLLRIRTVAASGLLPQQIRGRTYLAVPAASGASYGR